MRCSIEVGGRAAATERSDRRRWGAAVRDGAARSRKRLQITITEKQRCRREASADAGFASEAHCPFGGSLVASVPLRVSEIGEVRASTSIHA